jgi:Voltage gated chloride channel/Carbohydrate phosphorylase
LLALGRQNPNDSSESFNMAYLAIRGSGAVNSVSRLHGKVSRRLFAPLFPNWPEDEMPIGHVTNGVHMRGWDSAAADDLWTEMCGKDRWLGPTENLEQDMRDLSNSRLWEFRIAASKSLIDYARERLSGQLAASGASPAPTYIIPAYSSSVSCVVWALLVGPIAGVVSVGYVRIISWADRNRPKGWRRFAAPILGLGLLGVVSIWFPQVLGNGKDISQLVFTNQVAPMLLLTLLLLKPAATVLCMRSGAPGGLFTPSPTVGALLRAVLGYALS